FLISAIWNLYFSISAIFFPEYTLKLAYGEEVASAIFNNYYTYTFYNFQSAAILVFGIGYYIVSRDVSKNHGIVLLGIIGKLFFFIYYTIMYFTLHSSVIP